VGVMRRPWQEIGAVRVDACREFGVEDQRTRGVELREVGEGPPSHEEISIGRGLRVTLRSR
jgi:hypothetical protein